MPFTADEIANINNSSLETFIEKGKVLAQNISNKPMLKAFDEARGSFVGGNTYVSVGVKTGQGNGSLAGYTHDDQVAYTNSVGTKRAKYAWKEHHIGTVITHTELKEDGISVSEDEKSTEPMEGREAQVLANMLDEKNEALGEDYARSLDSFLHGDGTADTKALAGIRSLILDEPSAGTTGGISRASNTWWRNKAATAAASGAGSGDNKITSAVADGGALLQYLQKHLRLLGRYASGGTNWKFFLGNDVFDATEKELRANGNYTQDGFMREGAVDGGMAKIKFKGKELVWDPSLDDLGRSKFMYIIDMKRIKLLYMNGQRMKKHTPQRPYDRYVMYNGLTTTAVMLASQLNTSSVIEIN